MNEQQVLALLKKLLAYNAKVEESDDFYSLPSDLQKELLDGIQELEQKGK